MTKKHESYTEKMRKKGYKRYLYWLSPDEKTKMDHYLESLRDNNPEFYRKPAMTHEEFQKIQWGPRTQDRTKAIAKAVLVDGYKQSEVAEQYDLGRKRVSHIIQQAKKMMDK